MSANGKIPCPGCRGAGVVSNWLGGWSKCPQCDGAGTLPFPWERQAFDYAFATITFVDDNPLPQDLQLDDDAVFEQVGWMVRPNKAFPAFASQFQPTVQMSDASSGRQFSNAPLQLVNFSGALDSTLFALSYGQLFPLVKPYYWKPGTQALAMFQDPTGDNVGLMVQLVMKGYKLFNSQQAAA